MVVHVFENQRYELSPRRIVLRGSGGSRLSHAIVIRNTGNVAIDIGARGPNLALATACATGTHAIGESARMIREGYFADLVLFDPALIEDRATFEQPQLLSTGIDTVWVNGTPVFHKGDTTGAFPGRLVHRSGFQP